MDASASCAAVLLDVMMPVKSVYEVCQRICERADWRHIKIFMLTAKGRSGVEPATLARRRSLHHETVMPCSATHCWREILLKLVPLLAERSIVTPRHTLKFRKDLQPPPSIPAKTTTASS